MADLKPCPLCQHDLEQVVGDLLHIRHSQVLPTTGMCPLHRLEGLWDGEDVDLWNHRPLEDAKDATIERMRGLLGECLDLSKAVDMSGAIRGPSLAARIEAELAERGEELEGDGDD